MSGGWVYIMTNRPNGILYTGVTSDIGRRGGTTGAVKEPPHFCSKIRVIGA
jgi:predicted GIY-YIG superfamily endonuclease